MSKTNPNGIITLTTDFGEYDWYVGAVKGVILDRASHAVLVDISHEIPPQDVAHGAFVLANAFSYFPRGTVHLAVVDPGVGSGRKGVAIRTSNFFFVGPDNGLLSLSAETDGIKEIRELTNRTLFRSPVSKTFHARDVFAPIAAIIASDFSFSDLGKEVATIERLGLSSMVVSEGGKVMGKVVYIDGFGNLVTNLRAENLSTLGPVDSLEVEVATTLIHGVVDHYSIAKPGSPIALFGSIGFLEISVVDGCAQAELGIDLGDQVVVKKKTENGC